MSKSKKLNIRIVDTLGGQWHIAIDDGYCSYLYKLDASGNYSIDNLFKEIQSKIKRRKK